jgi:hypothetical protein
MSTIPRTAVRYGRHPHGAGWSNVIHRATGIVLGTVVRWPDGAWIVYLPFADERCDEAGTREDAAACLLSQGIHEPPGFELHDGKGGNDYVRDATETEARRLAPEAWKHWDLVGPFFTEPE